MIFDADINGTPLVRIYEDRAILGSDGNPALTAATKADEMKNYLRHYCRVKHKEVIE